MKAVLNRFKIQNFRSIDDSGWIASDRVTCLVGTNESGKTNLLVALWKLNPANNEPIIPLIDYPRKKYHVYESTKGKEVFASAEFEFSDSVANELSKLSGWHTELVRSAIVSRHFNGNYSVEYSKNKLISLDSWVIQEHINQTIKKLENSDLIEKEEESVISKIKSFLSDKLNDFNEERVLSLTDITSLKDEVTKFFEEHYKRKININNFVSESFYPEMDKIVSAFSDKGISVNEKCKQLIIASLPKFVYFSEYGNLDSEIYLPHVIENMKRTDLGEKERAKVRTLKVLFDFVNLSPKQILDLGKEALPVRVIEKTTNHYGQVSQTKEYIEEPEDVNIESESSKKKEREILLHSASTALTRDFRDWWKQGRYEFKFQADGNHFRIWVSDDKRPEPIELEGRSKGLQWFFSFFLVFLVESKDSHSNCILLLDEPGISLHPIAQVDLIGFFESLSKENQLIYTTHSPFLVNPNNLSGVHAMYVGKTGESIVSPDLRVNKKISEKSIYPIHAAIGITVSDTLLLGCQPVLVEGISDQIYLQQVKKYVLSKGKYINDKEIVFIPTGGVKGMSPVIKILQGRDGDFPYVLLDSDKSGKEKKNQLCSGLYIEAKEKVLSISDFIGENEFEIEDLMPKEELARIFAKQYRRVHSDDEFDYLYDKELPIVNQMEKFATENEYKLPDGWKVDLAKELQRNFDRIMSRVPDDLGGKWVNLIETLTK